MRSICKVAFVGQPEYFQACYENDLDDLYEVGSFPLRFNPALDMEADVSTMPDLIAFDPDVTVFFRGEYINTGLISRLNGIKIGYSTEPFPKLINGKFHYTKDSVNRFKFFLRFSERKFDFTFHYDEASRSFVELMGIRLSGYQPLPVATQIWRPPSSPVPPKWDIVFLGRSTPHRERFFGPLKRDLQFLHIAHGINGKDAMPYYNAGRIALNIHAEPELSWESRVHVLMACGRLVVSEPLSPNSYIKADRHYVEALSPRDLYEKCRTVISCETEYDGMRAAAREVVVRKLSARTVFPSLFQACVSELFPKPSYDLHRVRLAPLEVCAEYGGFEHLLEQLASEYA
jgi:glycosyltransferase involved in cell wall biosynthesis